MGHIILLIFKIILKYFLQSLQLTPYLSFLKYGTQFHLDMPPLPKKQGLKMIVPPSF